MSTIAIDFAQPIPLFPLPDCVLLPHATVPLHIFETRYRQMLADVLEGPRLIAMALLDRGADEIKLENGHAEVTFESIAFRPRIRPVVCVGYVARDQLLPDGRSNILLQGVCRAEIAYEIESYPYRRARLSPIESTTQMEIDHTDLRASLIDLFNDPLLKQLASISAIQNWLTQDIPTPALIDLAVMTHCLDRDVRYDMLAEPDPTRRADWLMRDLKLARRTLETAARLGDGQSPDGYALN